MDPNKKRIMEIFHADRNERVSYKMDNYTSIKSIEILEAIKQALE